MNNQGKKNRQTIGAKCFHVTICLQRFESFMG
jgi:hypothetical protein